MINASKHTNGDICIKKLHLKYSVNYANIGAVFRAVSVMS